MEGRERGRTLFEFSTEDVASCKCRDTGWDASYHTEVRERECVCDNALKIHKSTV